MADKKGVVVDPRAPPKHQSSWASFKQFLWNGETSQCLGRTGSSWAKILLFYFIFYIALSAFFAGLLAVFYQTLTIEKPKWTLDSGLIGTNPGLGFRPMPPESNIDSTLIWYDSSKESNYKYWADEIDLFLNSYNEGSSKNRVPCRFDALPQPGKVCKADLDVFQHCNKENKFGYNTNRPCIFLKLNKIYNWKPQVYNDPADLPSHMPNELKDHIAQVASMKPNETNVVWVSCAGENPADTENIKSRDYYPRMGFPAYYFPFTNIEGYTPPLVAVQFTVETGVLINIECKAWAHNIRHDRAERRGSVHFELMVD